MPHADPPAKAAELLRHWFGEAPHDVQATWTARRALWFGKDAAVDADIRARFGALQLQAAAGALASWANSPRGALALLLLLDQCPRNLFRATPRAFATDPQALRQALAMVDAGDDARLWPIERVFVYLPLEHAEELAVQEQSVALFAALRDAAPQVNRARFEDFLDFAQRHHAIIARFGRFPHRNAILGRASSPEELVFLQQPGSGF
ncbi:MAG: DUF924 family protein [Thiomonas sp.]